MARIVKIKPIPKKGGVHDFTLSRSLRKAGLSRVPGTSFIISPYFDNSFNKYWTGLDEDFRAIEKISDEKVKKVEKERLKKLKKQLEDATGIELSPRSDYYKKVAAPTEPNTKAGFALKDGENVFNLDIPEQYITYLWLSVHPQIAKSLKDWENGLCDPKCHWYIENITEEIDAKVSKKKEQNKGVVNLEKISENKRRKIAVVIGDLGIGYRTSNEEVYTILDDYIRDSKLEAVQEFNNYCAMSDEILDAKYLAKCLLNEGLVRRFGGGVIRETESSPALANSFEEFETLLSDPSQQEVYIVYSEKLKNYLALTYDLS